MDITDLSKAEGEIKKRIVKLEKEKREKELEIMDARNRLGGLRQERERQERETVGKAWHEYWSRHGTIERFGYVSGIEKASLGFEEMRE